MHKAKQTHTIVRDQAGLDAMVCALRGRELAIDTETSGLEWWAGQRPVGIALSPSRDQSFYVPFGHYTGEQQLTWAEVEQAVNVCVYEAPRLVMHNAKFDLHMLATLGIEPKCEIYDTMVAAYLVDEHRPRGLKDRAADEVNMPQLRDAEAVLEREVVALAKFDGQTKTQHLDQFGYSRVSIDLAGDYACYDVEGTFALYQNYEQKHEVSKCYAKVFQCEMELIRAAVKMERYGLSVDVPYLQELKDSLIEDAAMLEQSIHESIGKINLGSSSALGKRLKEMGVPFQATTSTGAPSVNRASLEMHAERFPVVGDILDWRTTNKLRSTYAEPLAEKAHEGRVHAHFSTVGARTGRMSCSSPNLQAVPRTRENEDGIDPDSIRKAFVVPDGFVRVFADYSQMEMRVLAEYSRDPELLDIFANDHDVHTQTAVRVFDNGDKAHRQIAKAINFGLVYGMSATGLGFQLGIEKEEAKSHMERYFKRFAGVKKYKETFCKWLIEQNGEFMNVFGRPHRIRDIKHKSWAIRAKAERQAINYLIQGTAADVMKVSIARMNQALEQRPELNAHMVLTVHDELQIDCPPAQAKALTDLMQSQMTRFDEIQSVSLKLDFAQTHTNWAEKKEAA